MTLGLSATTLLLLAGGLLGRCLGRDIPAARERKGLFLAALAAGLALYPMALGVGPFDPYSLGYPGQHLLLAALLLGSVLALVFRQTFLLAAILTSVLAFTLGLGASQNLWDYLVDPWLVLYAALRLGFRAARGLTIV